MAVSPRSFSFVKSFSSVLLRLYTRGKLVTQYADEQRNNADNYK